MHASIKVPLTSTWLLETMGWHGSFQLPIYALNIFQEGKTWTSRLRFYITRHRYISLHCIIIQYLTVHTNNYKHTYTDWEDLETPQNFWRNQDYHQAAPYSSWRNFCSSLILSSPSFARSYTSHVVHHFFHQYKFHESSHVLMINISNLWTPNTGWKNRQYGIGAIMSLLARIGPFETWISWRMMHHLLPPTDLHLIWTLTGTFPWNKTIRKKYVELL